MSSHNSNLGDNSSKLGVEGLNSYFCEVVFNIKSREGQRLFATVYNYLKQFRLERLYQPKEILQESYLRSLEAVQQRSTQIINYESFVKRVCYNSVRELQRKHRKEQASEFLPETTADESTGADPASILYYEQLQEKIGELSELDAQLICLRELERYPYKEVARILEERGLGTHAPAALRKQKQRLLDKLRLDSGWTEFF